jgi:hypothetical protein
MHFLESFFFTLKIYLFLTWHYKNMEYEVINLLLILFFSYLPCHTLHKKNSPSA